MNLLLETIVLKIYYIPSDLDEYISKTEMIF
jgi:hypothetical protein